MSAQPSLILKFEAGGPIPVSITTDALDEKSTRLLSQHVRDNLDALKAAALAALDLIATQ